jgi:hypothetical protein
MAQSGLTIRQKLNQRVFVSPPGTPMTYLETSVTSNTMGGYEGNTKTYSAPVTTIVVPYGFISHKSEYNSFGYNAEGECNLAVKHDIPVKKDDVFVGTLDAVSGTFVVKTVRPYPYDSVNLCTIITVKKEIF